MSQQTSNKRQHSFEDAENDHKRVKADDDDVSEMDLADDRDVDMENTPLFSPYASDTEFDPLGLPGDETDPPKPAPRPETEEQEREHAAWVSEWQAIYGREMVEEIGKVRLQWKIEVPFQRRDLVCGVAYSHLNRGDASEEDYGNYDNLPAANDRAIKLFAKYHPEHLPGNCGNSDLFDHRETSYDFDCFEANWDVTDEGCLMFLNCGEDGVGDVRVWAHPREDYEKAFSYPERQDSPWDYGGYYDSP